MKRTEKFFVVCLIVFVFNGLITGLSGGRGAEKNKAGGGTRKSSAGVGFPRKSDPVVCSGKQIKRLLSKNNNTIGAYTYRGSGLSPIPFQIDEKNDRGSYVLSENRGDGDNALSRQDEVVFMARDAGEKLPKEKRLTGFTLGEEIELADPIGSAKGWIYLFSFPQAPKLSDVRYVDYDPGNDTVITPVYTIRYMEKHPLVYDYFSISKSAGGRGKNIFDRFKSRMQINASLLKVKKTEEDFTTKKLGYLSGPVRVIRATENHLTMLLGIKTNPVVNNSIFYTDIIQSPALTTMDVPVSSASLMTGGWFIGTTDMNKNAYGMTFFNANNSKGVAVDGEMSAAEKHLDKRPSEWGVVADIGKAGWMFRTVKSPGNPLIPELYYVDDSNADDPPEADPGQVGSAGFQVNNVTDLKGGRSVFTVDFYVPQRYKPGAEKQFLDILDRPVKITVR